MQKLVCIFTYMRMDTVYAHVFTVHLQFSLEKATIRCVFFQLNMKFSSYVYEAVSNTKCYKIDNTVHDGELFGIPSAVVK